MKEPFVIIGGGIAGLSIAAALARRRERVLLLEAAQTLGARSSGLNAGMLRTAVRDPVNVMLARRTRETLLKLAPAAFQRTGGLYLCADETERQGIIDASGAHVAGADRLPPWLAGNRTPALWAAEDGVLDLPAVIAALATEARRYDAELQCGRRVEAIETQAGRASGVVVRGRSIRAAAVVDCAGAWSPSLPGAPTLADIVTPRRRHLFILESGSLAADCITWDLALGVYVRPHPEGLLASACDESVVPVTDEVPADEGVVALLRSKLSVWAPALAVLPIRRLWAGLRPLTPDHRFLIGWDPRLPGLFRLGGFGGHGMSGGLAAGELAAAMIAGECVEEAAAFAPSRFFT